LVYDQLYVVIKLSNFCHLVGNQIFSPEAWR